MLAVAFPDNQTQILPYNRVVKDLAGLTPDAFLAAVAARFTVTEGAAAPARRGAASACTSAAAGYAIDLAGTAPRAGGRCREHPRRQPAAGGGAGAGAQVADPRTDKRIDFVGGIRGTAELERLVDRGTAAVAFSLFPVGVGDLMRIADAGEIMPPKSTWFEPKLRDGLLTHLI